MVDDLPRRQVAPDPTEPEAAAFAARIERAQQDGTRLADYLARRDRATRTLRATEEAVRTAREHLVDATADVGRIDALSLTRVRAGLHRARVEHLDVEHGEQQAAEYVVAAAEARRLAAARDRETSTEAITGLGDVAGLRGQALADKEAWLWTAREGVGAALVDVAERRGRRQAEKIEIAEAERAATAAATALEAMAGELGGADEWPTAEHDRLDRAAEQARVADAALTHLTVELGDIGEQGVGALGVDGLARTFDTWFGDVVGDLSAAAHLQDSRERVEAARAAVQRVAGRLTERRSTVEQDLIDLARRRDGLLG